MMGIMTTTVDSSDSMPERLQEGSAAPDFTLPAVIPGFTESRSINLSDVLDAGRRVVLYSLEKLRKFAEHDHLTFPLLSDPDLTVHKLYGAYGEKKLYGKVHVGVIRSTLVINPDGSVAIARYNVRAKGHVDSLLKALEKLEKLEK